jgi:hypothetical protein
MYIKFNSCNRISKKKIINGTWLKRTYSDKVENYFIDIIVLILPEDEKVQPFSD